MECDPAFLLDRGLGSKVVPAGLRKAGWTVTTLDERYGRESAESVADVDWIRDAAKRSEIGLCKDRMVAKRPLEAEAIALSGARILVIASAQITGQQMIERLLENEAKIRRLSHREGPWVFSVAQGRLAELRLRYP